MIRTTLQHRASQAAPSFVLALVVSTLIACQGAPLASDDVPPAPDMGLDGNLRAHVGFLASDVLRGRDTGTLESLRAAKYISQVLKAAGAEPAGESGSWFQAMDLKGMEVTRPPALFLMGHDVDPASCVHGTDFRLLSGISPVTNARIVTMNEPTIPEGLGDEPVALFLDLGEPVLGFRFAQEHREELAAAADVVIFAGREEPGSARPAPSHLVGRPGAPASIMLGGPALARVRSGELTHVTFDLQGTAPVDAVNVVGRIPGVGSPSRPELADEVLVFTAHYDHVGVHSDPEAEDQVFNGANDDASGVAAVLELARLFGEGQPPARTLLFVLVTAEEQGLLGSRYFVKNSPVPLEQIVCNLNFEMIGEADEGAGGSGKLFLTGFERSNVGQAWVDAGLPFVADPYPQLQLFFRSDNLPFVEAGIPGHSISSGGDAEHYHQLSDETSTMEWAHMKACVEASYEAILSLAQGTLDPAWVEGGNPNGG